MSLETIQMMWVQNHLPRLARVCIESFVRCGHPVKLYCYDGCDWSFPGVEIADAADVLPRDQIFQPQIGAAKGSLSVFSDLFRYRLLNDRGGWWADADTYCLRPWRFEAACVSSRDCSEPWRIVTTPTKVPAGQDYIQAALSAALAQNKRAIVWSEIGCQLLCRLAKDFRNLAQITLPHEVFMPWDYRNMERMVMQSRLPQVPPNGKALHLFNEVWRRKGYNPDAMYPIHEALDELSARVIGEDRVWGASDTAIKEPTGVFEQDVTFVIKTFNRPAALGRLLTSLREYYPGIPVLVADDGDQPLPAEVLNDGNVRVFRLPFNSGTCTGRNFLVDRVATPYFLLLDDDYIFTKDTDIQELYRTLHASDAAIAGGVAADRYDARVVYCGLLEFQGGTLTLKAGNRGGDEQHQVVDILPNFWLGRTRIIRQVRWDDHFKCAWEHPDLFLKLLGRYKVIFCNRVSVLHDAKESHRDPAYAKFRQQDASISLRYLMDKWCITKFESFGQNIACPTTAYQQPAPGAVSTPTPPSAPPVKKFPGGLLFDPRPPKPGQIIRPSQDTRTPRYHPATRQVFVQR